VQEFGIVTCKHRCRHPNQTKTHDTAKLVKYAATEQNQSWDYKQDCGPKMKGTLKFLCSQHTPRTSCLDHTPQNVGGQDLLLSGSAK